jgi:hypothetical protein
MLAGMPRKTPRSPEEARAIVRALRGRYISGEAEATARAAMARLQASPARPSPMEELRRREQITMKDERPFTEEEKARARAVLQRLRTAYPRNS